MEFGTLAAAEQYLQSFVDYERAVSFDYERLGLGRIRALLSAVGRPESGLPCIHIAGSKGKGSVALAAESLLRVAGRRVGTYTSPHLETWRERFRIDGRPVGEQELCQGLSRIRPHVDRLRGDPDLSPSFFDVSTALALELFRHHGVDVGVIEVGLGGRLDSTNIVESKVSVITVIQFEHTEMLGDTLEAICIEKAGILRPGVPVLHGVLDPEAYGALLARSAAEDTPLEEVATGQVELSESGLDFQLQDGRRLHAPLLGGHQAGNLALAVRAVETFLGRVLGDRELAALETLRLPARIERFGDVILDSAHTPDSARALRVALQTVWPDRAWVLGLSVSRDKDIAGISSELAPATRACVLARIGAERAQDPEALLQIIRGLGIETVESPGTPLQTLERALVLRRPDEWVVLTGSIRFAGALRPHLLAQSSDSP